MAQLSDTLSKIRKYDPLDTVVHNAILGKDKNSVDAPPAMPTQDDAAIQKARSASISAQLQRSGRTSTILNSNTGDSLG